MLDRDARSSLGVKTYEAAPVPEPETVPSRIPRRVESLYGITMPMQSEDPTKKARIRQTNERKAGGRIFRGASVSAATIEMYSGPVILLRYISSRSPV